jgi:hypothetical protein
MIKSKTITDHKLLKDVHEESLQNPRQKQLVPVQPSERAFFEGIRTPHNVLQIKIEDVQTLEQHRPDARSINIQQRVCFQKLTLFGKSLQSVRTMSSSSKYSRVLFERRKDLVKTVWMLC